MSDVQVSQAARDAVQNWRRGQYSIHEAFARFEQDIIDRLAARPAPVGEPAAWMYITHTPEGPKRVLQRSKRTHYDGYPVTDETPLYTRPALDVDGLVEKVARAMLDSIENGGNITDFLDHLADYPERALSKLATAALAAIKDATHAQ